MAHRFCSQSTATLRRRFQVGSSLALRAVAHGAKSVQSVVAHSASKHAPAPTPVITAKVFSIAVGGKTRQQAPCSFAPNRQLTYRLRTRQKSRLAPFASVLRSKTRPAVKGNAWQSLLSAPTKVSIILGAGTSQCLLRVLANQSLNRTHCGVPPFGLKKPSPNASPPQWAG